MSNRIKTSGVSKVRGKKAFSLTMKYEDEKEKNKKNIFITQ